MKQTIKLALAVFVVALLTGCSSKLGVNIEVVLKTDDKTVTIDEVAFISANSLMSASAARPETGALIGPVRHRHDIDSPDGNFVIVDLLQNGEPFRSEIYRLDSTLLSKIGNKSGWIKPGGISSEEDDGDLSWRLMKNPDSFQPAKADTEFFSELHYEVVKR